nr:hypothetical transcript [Hymenolepis microstoma]
MERKSGKVKSNFNTQQGGVNELYLIWVGDLERDERSKIFHTQVDRNDFEPKTMVIHSHRNKITVGSNEGNAFGDYELNSTLCSCLIDPRHATILRMPNGSFRLLDHSQNGTFLNYRKIASHANLSHGDIICFGHPDSAKIGHGNVVEPFYWDLKYKVFIGLHEEVLLKIGEAINAEEINRHDVSLTIQIEIAHLEYKKLTTNTN